MSNDPSGFEITPEFASQFVRDVEATMPASGPSGMPSGKLIGPPHAHIDGPCGPECYEPSPPTSHTCDEKAGAVIVGLGDVERCGCGMSSMPNVRGVLNVPGVRIAHVHTSQTGVGFDPTCEGCRQIENARRSAPGVRPALGAAMAKVDAALTAAGVSGMPPIHYGPAKFEQAKRGRSCLAGGPIIEIGPDSDGNRQQSCVCDRTEAAAVQPLPVRDFESAEFPVRVAKTLRVERYGAQPARLFIDGEPFPYATDGGYAAGPATKRSLPRVTFSLVGYSVEFVDTMEKRPPALDLVDECGPDCPKCAQLLAEAREEREQGRKIGYGRGFEQGITEGRRRAAEAIKEQARMFGVNIDGDPTERATLSVEVAAQLAEGTTGVTDGKS